MSGGVLQGRLFDGLGHEPEYVRVRVGDAVDDAIDAANQHNTSGTLIAVGAGALVGALFGGVVMGDRASTLVDAVIGGALGFFAKERWDAADKGLSPGAPIVNNEGVVTAPAPSKPAPSPSPSPSPSPAPSPSPSPAPSPAPAAAPSQPVTVAAKSSVLAPSRQITPTSVRPAAPPPTKAKVASAKAAPTPIVKVATKVAITGAKKATPKSVVKVTR